jgi:hypothetical protein
MGEWSCSSTILNFGIHATVAFNTGESPWYMLDKGLGVPQNRSGRSYLYRESSFNSPANQPVARRTD